MGIVGARNAAFMFLMFGRYVRNPEWVTGQDPLTPPNEKGEGSGWILYR